MSLFPKSTNVMFHTSTFNEETAPRAKFKSATEKKEYFCETCHSKDGYCSETEVEVHRQINHKPSLLLRGEPTQLDICLICSQSFEDRMKLHSHIKEFHLYSSPDSLRIERQIYTCNDCQHIFFNKGLLHIHYENMHIPFHDRRKEQLCPHCNIFINRSSLWHHFEAKGLKSVSTCPFCFIKLPNRSELKKHIDTHLKHLHCESCNYQASRRQHYLNHVRNNCNSSGVLRVKNLNNYFIKGHIPIKWTYKVPFVPRGVNLHGMLLICVLCRHICIDKDDLKLHLDNVHGEKLVVPSTNNKVCSCGEEFSNNILFRHHVFKMGAHHVLT